MAISSAELHVRPITVADFAAVAALLAELGRPPLKPEKEAAMRAVFARHIRRSDTASFIAERHGESMGFISLEFRERLNQVTLEAWVPDLIVTEKARGTGVGHALLQAAFNEARRRGCHRLTLESGYKREVAHRFYLREGMTDAGKYFYISFV